jgi:release factor glutamine methyltransferase
VTAADPDAADPDAADPDGRPLETRLRAAAARLAAAGVPNPGPDAAALAAHVLGIGRGELAAARVTGLVPTAEQAERFADLVDQRAARVPLQHLTGRAGFRRIELAVGPGVFVPRPETEVVAGLAIEAAEALVADGARPVVVDLCTGSAAIALSVAVELPSARVVALEREPLAHAWAARNVERIAPGRVDLRLGDVVGADGDVLADLVGAVDVVVANPPYVPDWARPIDPEVAEHDPHPALYGGGPEGLAVPAAVITLAARLLRPGGLLVMEHGDAQGAATRELAAAVPGWATIATAPDLTGRDRALLARRADRGPDSQASVGDFPP